NDKRRERAIRASLFVRRFHVGGNYGGRKEGRRTRGSLFFVCVVSSKNAVFEYLYCYRCYCFFLFLVFVRFFRWTAVAASQCWRVKALPLHASFGILFSD
ncbi:unnamed protein product, partial [Pylaiella littoralis]